MSSTTSLSELHRQRAQLPVYRQKQQFQTLFQSHQVLIAVGETGSGKTTQIPQFIYEMGYGQGGTDTGGAGTSGRGGLIGITQPRRVAAVTVSQRVADEMGAELGGLVGYAVRFDDRTSEDTRIKFLTDGMLLREALLHPLLEPYAVVVLDEAHERTLQTDILFGVVKRALRTRPDLRVVVMSATLDVAMFQGFFPGSGLFKVPGRTHPVQVMYTLEPEPDYLDAAIVAALQIHLDQPAGDVLVFLTGQEEIEAAEELLADRARRLPADRPKLIPVPLFAALPPDQQVAAFAPAPRGSRKVILSTNIAESSVTIPGVRYVVDPGLVKCRMFSPGSGMERLVVVPASKQQAWQRAGRAGREAPGVCYRLFTETDFEALRPAAVPEAQRVALDTVVLQLRVLGVEHVEKFDFLEPPSPKAIHRALVHLLQLGALSRARDVTPMGRRMAALPLPPLYAKLLLLAPRFSCVEEAVALLAMLSVDSPFVSPKDKREQAGRMHSLFAAREGDHLTLVNVLRAFLANGCSHEWCREHFLNARNLRQAVNVQRQLEELAERLRLPHSTSWPDHDPLRRCLVAAAFMKVARRIPDAVTGARARYKTMAGQLEVSLHPSSTLFARPRPPTVVVYAELVETKRQYLRVVTEVEEEWLTELAPSAFRQAESSPASNGEGGGKAAAGGTKSAANGGTKSAAASGSAPLVPGPSAMLALSQPSKKKKKKRKAKTAQLQVVKRETPTAVAGAQQKRRRMGAVLHAAVAQIDPLAPSSKGRKKGRV